MSRDYLIHLYIFSHSFLSEKKGGLELLQSTKKDVIYILRGIIRYIYQPEAIAAPAV
jgi:hypothetical protein